MLRDSGCAVSKEHETTVLTLATYVVFIGKTAMQRVIKHGVSEGSPIHGQMHLFMPEDAQDFVNPAWKSSNN